MKQVLFIHGGNAFSREEDYVLKIKNLDVDLEYKEKKRWNYVPVMQEALGGEWQFIRPEMPNGDNAKYEYWKMWFEKYVPHLQDGVVLVGHSLGAMFLARYLSENVLPVRVGKLFLLAGEIESPEVGPGEEEGENFYVQDESNFVQLDQSAREVYVLHSKDDFVVPYHHGELFAKKLPNAQLVTFTDRNHFLQEEFPEIIELIKE